MNDFTHPTRSLLGRQIIKASSSTATVTRRFASVPYLRFVYGSP